MACLRVEFRSVEKYVSLTTALHEIQVRQWEAVVIAADQQRPCTFSPAPVFLQGRLDCLLDCEKWLKDPTKHYAT